MTVAVVTGGSRGIGAATARRLARDGWDIAIGYRNDDQSAAAVVAACEAEGVAAAAVAGDLSTAEPVVALFDAAAKAGIDLLTVGLAPEVALEGIRVNTVRPGIIRTEIHASGGEPNRADRLAGLIPLQRPGETDEIAAAIAWLCSAESSYATTGSSIDVSGSR